MGTTVMQGEVEIFFVVICQTFFIWALAAARLLVGDFADRINVWLRLLFEFMVLVPPQAAIFLYPEWMPLVTGGAFMLACVLSIAVMIRRSRSASGIVSSKTESLPAPDGAQGDLYAEISRKPFFTNLRSTVMVLCTFGVVMAGTEPFPSRFLKRRDFSVSLMDGGTGCIVTTFGMTFARMFLDSSLAGYKNGMPKVRPTFIGTLRMTGILFLISMVRYITVAAGAPAEGTAYGIHWNFFTTLSILPLSMYVLMRWTPAVFAMPLGLLIAAMHQIMLTTTGLDSKVLQQSLRTDIGPTDLEGFRPQTFLELNLRGIVAIPGYIALQLIALGVASEVFTFRTAKQHRWLLAKWAAVSSVFGLLVLAMNVFFDLHPSRVIANAPYVLYVVACVTFVGAINLFVDLFVQLPDRPAATELLESVNYNQLLYYGAVNLCTGILNMINGAILHDARRTLPVTLGIIALCIVGAHLLRRKRWCLRL